MRVSEKRKVEKSMKQLACDCLWTLLDDPKKRVVIGFRLPKKVRVTRARNGNGIHVEIGKPNYQEGEYIKKCKKAKCLPKKYWFKFFK